MILLVPHIGFLCYLDSDKTIVKLEPFCIQRVQELLSLLTGPLLNSLKERSSGIREGEMTALPSFFPSCARVNKFIPSL